MRIALLAWESLHSIMVGGVAAHVTELACALERKGHEVHVFTRMGRSDHPQYERIHGVHYHRCPFPAHPDFVEEINDMCRSFVDAVFGTEDYIGPFDIVHAHDWLTAHAMVWIKRGRGRKTIFTVHSTEYGRCGNNIYNGASERIRGIEWLGTNEAWHNICVSQSLKSELMSLYNVPDNRVHVIYNGIAYWDFDGWIDAGAVRKMHGIGPMDPLVVFIGRMTSQKGPDVLVEAIPHILAQYSNAKFVLAGEGDMRGYVEQRARQLGVHHAIRFFGHLERWKLIDLYKACDCVCVPSRNEPFGIVVLEAWSAGKPIVATATGGPSEIVWHDVNGYKIHPSPDSVAWGISALFADFEHARWMGHNGRTTVETSFSWDSIADRVLEVYAG